MTVCQQLLPEIEKAQSVTPQTTKFRYRTVISDQWIHGKFKKNRYSATLLLSIFANIDKSNVAVAPLFFKLSMVPMVGNDCPISIFSGLGGHGLSFFDFGQ